VTGTIVGARSAPRPSNQASRPGQSRAGRGMHMCLDTSEYSDDGKAVVLVSATPAVAGWPRARTHAWYGPVSGGGLCKHATRAANNSPDWALEHGTGRARSRTFQSPRPDYILPNMTHAMSSFYLGRISRCTAGYSWPKATLHMHAPNNLHSVHRASWSWELPCDLHVKTISVIYWQSFLSQLSYVQFRS